jgi:hypothetical protein
MAAPPLYRGVALATAAPPLYRGVALATAAPPLYRGVALATAAPPLYRGFALVTAITTHTTESSMNPNPTAKEIVISFWNAMDQREWEKAASFLAPQVTVTWHHTREIFRDREAFITMNRQYPGNWRIRVERIHEPDDEIMTVVAVTDAEQVFHAISFFQVQHKQIVEITEYWCSPEEPSDWRKQGGWSERY